MSTAQAHNEINKESMDSPVNGINGNSDHFDHATGLPQQPMKQRKPYDYGGNPLAHVNTGDSVRLPAFGGDFQPGLYKPPTTKFANPAPLGLSAFALTASRSPTSLLVPLSHMAVLCNFSPACGKSR
jgi:hypothetical protein